MTWRKKWQKKLEQKEYLHHTMHPGGLKRTPAKKVMTEKPEQVIRHAVVKMLPKNKLREARLLRLSFSAQGRSGSPQANGK
jgi:large subunit ribosomal protein L13